MKILGITGGIATGKSTVTRMLADLGAPTISADTLAHTLLTPGAPTTLAVLSAFPDCGDDAGEVIDRRALGRRVFADADARHRLEALTHPAIIAALQSQIALWHHSTTVRVAVAEIPLLFEAHLEALTDCIVVASCAEPTQIARLKTRLHCNDIEARRQIAAQWPLAEKIARADVVITTEGVLEDTRRQVETLWNSL